MFSAVSTIETVPARYVATLVKAVAMLIAPVGIVCATSEVLSDATDRVMVMRYRQVAALLEHFGLLVEKSTTTVA